MIQMYYILDLTTGYRGNIFINIHTQIIGFEQNVWPPFSHVLLNGRQRRWQNVSLLFVKWYVVDDRCGGC